MMSFLSSARAGKMICSHSGQIRTLVCTPPRNRVSFVEKVAHGVVMFIGFLAIPAYVTLNLKNYRSKA